MTRDELIGVLKDAAMPDDEVMVGRAGALLALPVIGVEARVLMVPAAGEVSVAQLVIGASPTPLHPA